MWWCLPLRIRRKTYNHPWGYSPLVWMSRTPSTLWYRSIRSSIASSRPIWQRVNEKNYFSGFRTKSGSFINDYKIFGQGDQGLRDNNYLVLVIESVKMVKVMSKIAWRPKWTILFKATFKWSSFIVNLKSFTFSYMYNQSYVEFHTDCKK